MIINEEGGPAKFQFATHSKKINIVMSNVCHNCVDKGGIDGTPSAFIVLSAKVATSTLHCFACCNTMFILSTNTPSSYNCREKHIIGEKMEISHFNLINRVSVLDWPCGTGKTYTILKIVKSMAESNFYVSTSRHALAIALGNNLAVSV
jgi:hypothetical protein